jgi:hypothetical protein
MAPELCRNDHDHRVDLYNLGHVMLQLADRIKEMNGVVDPVFESLQVRLRSTEPYRRPLLSTVLEMAQNRSNGINVSPLPAIIARIVGETGDEEEL